MERQFTRQAENALKLAKTTAKTCGHGYIGTEHLLAGLLKEPEGTAGKVLQEFNVEEEKLRELISSLVTPVQGNTAAAETKDPQYSPRARRIIEQAEEDAESMECLCGTEHLLLSLLKETDCVATRLLFTMGVNIQKLFAAILTAMGFDNDTIAEEFQYARNAGNKKVTSTPTLDQYSRDLTQLAAEGKLDPVIGRDKEITRLIQILSRRTKNNPCLTGEPGVGKTAIVEGLAQRIVMGMVPDTVKDKRLVVLDLSGMVAGSKYRGEFEERIKNVIQEVKEHQGILLFIDEIHTIIGAGGAEGALDASNILKPSLSRGEIQLIGATTLEEYRKYIEKDAALERRFQPVTVEEPSSEETVEILKGLRPYYEKHHGVKEITDDMGNISFDIRIPTNQELARNLKGHLLLIHGDIDNNVHPANTIVVVDELIKAGKRFDMLIVPGKRHHFDDYNEYYYWRMVDYFSEYLRGERETGADIKDLKLGNWFQGYQ